MNDMTRITWADVSKGIIIDDILYAPVEAPKYNAKCGFCDYLLSGKCNGVKPCLAFGNGVYLKNVGKVADIFVEAKHKDLLP